MSTINPSAILRRVENFEATDELLQEDAVRERYSRAAQSIEAERCCPVTSDGRYPDASRRPVSACDYGVGDPSSLVRSGAAVLELGSGAGKICFIAAQIVGSK